MQDTPIENPEDVHVKLKNILGIAPTVYLPVIYAVLLSLLVFLVLFLPGIRNPGTIITISGAPYGAAISVDGVVLGSTSDGVFVPTGERTLAISKPGFRTVTQEHQIPGRLFASLIFPRRQKLSITLDPISAPELADTALSELSQWALVGEASGQYQFPPIARELGRDLGSTGAGDFYPEFAVAALGQVDSEAQLGDLTAGALLAAGGGSAPGPLSLTSVLQTLGQLSQDYPDLPLHLAGIQSGRRSDAIEESSWIESSLAARAGIENQPSVTPAAALAATTSIDGVVFLRVSPGAGLVGGGTRAERGGDIAYLVAMDGFLVSQTEITVELYTQFLLENPAWSLANREVLESEGLVDNQYLRDWEDGTPSPTLPVRNVSAFAAHAFAQWFARRVPGDVRLPTEAEWDYLAALDSPQNGVFAVRDSEGPAVVSESTRGNLGLYGLVGNVWEWTSTPFARYGRYYRLDDRPNPLDERPEGPASNEQNISPTGHLVVRGGGWATPASDFTRDDRGSLPPHWCSPAVGFRLVISD